MLTVGSLFSGIGGLDEGLQRAGWHHAFLCESDEWRRTVLAHHFPGVPIYEDVRDVGGGQKPGWEPVCPSQPDPGTGRRRDRIRAVDLLCGGFPCQDVSVAGRRAGLAGERSGLFHEFARVAELVRPRWLLVENVPGLLSSQGGRDFGTVLGTLADIGYGLAWRILDSRYFGVPQRRRRVFIVGTVADGDPRAAAERCGQILAVGTRCPRHPATRTEAGADVAGALGGVPPGGGWRIGADEAAVNQLVAALLAHGSNPNSNMAGRRREDDQNLIGFDAEQSYHEPDELAYLTRKLRRAVASPETGVRRLTPTECERLQAFPDNWTALGPDSRRYAALGDAVTVSVAQWIGERIAATA